MRIHVVGLGAVGSFVAFHLRRTLSPKHSLVALHRRHSAPTISQIPDGRPILLESEGITHSQDGVEHNTFSTPRERPKHDLTSLLDPQRQPQGDYELALDRHYDPHELPRIYGAIESLIVTTKAHAVPSVIAGLRGHLSRDSTIVLLHNGMGMYEKLVESFFPDPMDRPNFVLATNTHGLWRKDPMHVVQAGVGDIQLGIVPDPAGRDFEASFRQAHGSSFAELSLNDIINVTDEQDPSPRYLSLRNTIAALTGARALSATWRPFGEVQTAMRRKLVANSFVNPISALLQCKNGDVLGSSHSYWVLSRLCGEAERVFKVQYDTEVKNQRRAYLHLPDEEKEAVGQLRQAPFPRLLSSLSLETEIKRVIEVTKNNYSSMYWDVKLGQPTEIKYINGYLLKLAQKYHVSTVVNESLFHLIKMRTSIPLVAKPS